MSSSLSHTVDLFPTEPKNVNAHGYESLTGRVVGVDEVGRGPLIGDVVAAAVILPAGCLLSLNDSKKLSEKKREILSQHIQQQATAYAIGVASAVEIDEINILQATMLAMTRAMDQIAQQVLSKNIEIERVYVDGNRAPKWPYITQTVVKGDAKVAEVSAASIIAKVYRDQQMLELDHKYPEYGFARHKGYPTAEHLQKLKALGLIDGYRKSFKPVKAMLENQEQI